MDAYGLCVPQDELDLAEAIAGVHDNFAECGMDNCPDCAEELSAQVDDVVDAFVEGDPED